MAWLLGETGASAVRAVLAGAEMVLTSELTLIECERALLRATHGGAISAADASNRSRTFRSAAAHWNVLPLQAELVDRARQPFPREPVRTLDAIHLASMIVARALVPSLRVLALDERIRRNARELGFEVLPE